MDIGGLVGSLATGAIGGNVAGWLNQAKSLGPIWNTVTGVLGGAAGGQALNSAGLLSGSGILNQILGGVLGGGVLQFLVGLFKKKTG